MLVSLVLFSKLVQTVNGYRHIGTGRLLEITFSIVWDERDVSVSTQLVRISTLHLGEMEPIQESNFAIQLPDKFSVNN